MSKDKDELIPELVRNTLNELNHQVTKKNQYIKLLEDRIEELETENFYLRKNQKTEPDSEGNITIEIETEQPTDNVEEGLKKMGLEAEDLVELSDLLDEVIKKESDKEEDER